MFKHSNVCNKTIKVIYIFVKHLNIWKSKHLNVQTFILGKKIQPRGLIVRVEIIFTLLLQQSKLYMQNAHIRYFWY